MTRGVLSALLCFLFSLLLAANASLLFAANGTTASPFEIEVKAAINRCPRSYGARQQSCQIKLPSGTIRGHWKIGGDTTMTTQVAVCLIGQGPGWGSVAPDGKIGAGGTTIAYEGPPGGTLLDVVAGDFFCARDLTLAMDGAAVVGDSLRRCRKDMERSEPQ